MAEQEVNKKPETVPGVDTIFEERAVSSDNEQFAAARGRLFLEAVFLSLLLILTAYAFSPDTRVKAVAVHGENYLSKAYLASVSGVKPGLFYYLQFPGAIEARMEQDPLVEEAEVTLCDSNLIEITVKEKQPIGYRYDEETPTLLCTDGSVTDLTSDYMSILARVPYITGFNEENATHLLTSGFKDVSPDMIDEMAEVIQYPLSYDPEAIEIRMRDGGIFFSNYFSLALVNDYPKISSLMTNRNYCLYADNGTTVAAARACPWDEVPVEYEYWTDEDGNYIYNKWGDKAVKHYYYNPDAGYYLDDNGNRILIPIDAYGSDVRDPDFLNHYFLGWYKNGYLEIPEEGEEGSEEETAEDSGEESGEASEEGADEQKEAADDSGQQEEKTT